jgi:hypothetical protein
MVGAPLLSAVDLVAWAGPDSATESRATEVTAILGGTCDAS